MLASRVDRAFRSSGARRSAERSGGEWRSHWLSEGDRWMTAVTSGKALWSTDFGVRRSSPRSLALARAYGGDVAPQQTQVLDKLPRIV